MARPRPTALAAITFFLVALMAPPVPTWAEEDAARVVTEYVALASHARNRSDPGDRVASSDGQAVEMTTAAPAGTHRVPGGRTWLYGEAAMGGRQARFVLAMAADGAGTLAFDLDGDGNLGGAGQEFRGPGRTRASGGPETTTWRFREVSLGLARADVQVQWTAPAWKAVLVTDPPQELVLSPTPPAGTAPVAAPGLVRYASVACPSGRASSLAFVRGEGERLTVLVDRNANGTIGEAGEVFAAPVAGRDPGALYWQADNLPLTIGARSLALQEVAGEARASLKPSGARRGKARVGGAAEVHVHLLDADLDGSYDSAGDLWWAGPVDHLAQVRKLKPDAMVLASEPVFVGGRPWRLISVDREGNAVLMHDPRAGSAGDWLHRRAERVNRERWWPVFQAEEATFRREQGIPPGRPRTPTPLHWIHDMDVSAALAEAQRTNKPILVDFEADWCSWCKRFDYYVYGDAEVADLLRSFVLLKINAEFHFSGDFERLGGEGLPFLVFLDAQGRPLTFTIDDHGEEKTCSGPPGFQPPHVFAQTVRAALAASRAR